MLRRTAGLLSALLVVAAFLLTSAWKAERNRDLMDSLGRHDAAGVRSALESGADPNAAESSSPWNDFKFRFGIGTVTMKYHSPALTMAALMDEREIVDLLLKSGARPDERDIGGSTALIHAAKTEDTALVKRLIAAGADVNGKDNSGLTALKVAQGPSTGTGGVFRLNLAMVDLLKKAGAKE
jgi:ankyrin repeat protein